MIARGIYFVLQRTIDIGVRYPALQFVLVVKAHFGNPDARRALGLQMELLIL